MDAQTMIANSYEHIASTTMAFGAGFFSTGVFGTILWVGFIFGFIGLSFFVVKKIFKF